MASASGVNLRPAAHDEGVVAGEGLAQLAGRQARAHVDVGALPQEGDAFLGDRVGDEDAGACGRVGHDASSIPPPHATALRGGVGEGGSANRRPRPRTAQARLSFQPSESRSWYRGACSRRAIGRRAYDPHVPGPRLGTERRPGRQCVRRVRGERSAQADQGETSPPRGEPAWQPARSQYRRTPSTIVSACFLSVIEAMSSPMRISTPFCRRAGVKSAVGEGKDRGVATQEAAPGFAAEIPLRRRDPNFSQPHREGGTPPQLPEEALCGTAPGQSPTCRYSFLVTGVLILRSDGSAS